jgi:hypothetical protein
MTTKTAPCTPAPSIRRATARPLGGRSDIVCAGANPESGEPMATRKPAAKVPRKPPSKPPAKPRKTRKPAAPKATVRRTVLASVLRDLDELPDELANSALGASAIALAREMDKPKNSATSKSMCSKSLLDLMNRLRELAPPKEEEDGLDDLSKRRAARLAGNAA